MSLEIVLWAYSKCRNTYSRKSAKSVAIQQENKVKLIYIRKEETKLSVFLQMTLSFVEKS